MVNNVVNYLKSYVTRVPSKSGIASLNPPQEFYECIQYVINQKHENIHTYRIHRIMNLSILLGANYRYLKSDRVNIVTIEVVFEDFQPILFDIDTLTGYGNVWLESRGVLSQLQGRDF